MLLDEVQPRWHARHRHQVPVAAEPVAVLAAVEALTWGEVPVFRTLMAIRSLGLGRLRAGAPVLDSMVRAGFAPLRRAADELVYGAVGKPWSPGGQLRPLAGDDPAAVFGAAAEPGWARMAFNFRVASGQLTTETRVLLTDAAARRQFAVYWTVVGPFSGLIRKAWLAAVVRRVQARPT